MPEDTSTTEFNLFDQKEPARVVALGDETVLAAIRYAIRQQSVLAEQFIINVTHLRDTSIGFFYKYATKELSLPDSPQHRQDLVDVLQRFEKEIPNITFLNLGYRELGNENGKTQYKVTSAGIVPISAISFGGVSMVDFVLRELSGEQMALFFKPTTRHIPQSKDEYAEIIFAFLALPFEEIELPAEELKEAAIFVKNIITFRTFLFNALVGNRGSKKIATDCLSRFSMRQLVMIGISMAWRFGSNVFTILDSLWCSGQVPWATKSRLYSSAQNIVFDLPKKAPPLVVYAEERGGVYEARIDFLSDALLAVQEALSKEYRQIVSVLSGLREITIDAGDSLFALRLGIEKVSMEYSSANKAFIMEVNFENGYKTWVKIDNKDLTDVSWIVKFSEEMAVPIQYVYELGIYVNALLVDLARAVGTKKLVEKNGTTLQIEKLKLATTANAIARRLLSLGGFANPLPLITTKIFEEMPLRETLHLAEDLVVSRRTIRFPLAEPVDIVDPETAEVKRWFANGYSYSFVNLLLGVTIQDSHHEILKQNGIRLMIYNPKSKLLNVNTGLDEKPLAAYDLSNAQEALELFGKIGEISILGACEYVLLHYV